MNKLLIWGTGAIAEKVLSSGICGEVLGFIQSKKSMETYHERKVYGIEEIPEEYDFIIVANSFGNEIYHTCLEQRIPLDKVLFLKSIKSRQGLEDLSVIRRILGEKNFAEYCSEFALKEASFFTEDRKTYTELNRRENFRIQERYLWPVLGEKYAMAGEAGNYFLQDLWAANKILRAGAKVHFDIGSRIDGFIAHLLAADVDVTVIDVREFPLEIAHLHTVVDDATTLRQIPDNSIESMSALCSLEHFGLGRYGDPVNPESCFECFQNIQKKLKKGGMLYISVPIGRERVEFNAHRVFYASTIVKCFSSLSLKEFSCAAEGKIEYHADIHKYDCDPHNGEYRYGLFMFQK